VRELVKQRAGLKGIEAARESDALQIRDRRAGHRRVGSHDLLAQRQQHIVRVGVDLQTLLLQRPCARAARAVCGTTGTARTAGTSRATGTTGTSRTTGTAGTSRAAGTAGTARTPRTAGTARTSRTAGTARTARTSRTAARSSKAVRTALGASNSLTPPDVAAVQVPRVTNVDQRAQLGDVDRTVPVGVDRAELRPGKRHAGVLRCGDATIVVAIKHGERRGDRALKGPGRASSAAQKQQQDHGPASK